MRWGERAFFFNTRVTLKLLLWLLERCCVTPPPGCTLCRVSAFISASYSSLLLSHPSGWVAFSYPTCCCAPPKDCRLLCVCVFCVFLVIAMKIYLLHSGSNWICTAVLAPLFDI